MTVVVKVGGAVAAASAEAVLALAAHDEVCVVHGAGPQISAEMERAGIPVEFVDGRRVTTAEGIAIVRASLAAVNQTLCAAIGERAVGLFGDEIGLEADPVPALGLVGEARTSSLPAVTEALAAGKIPVVAPIAQGPLNVNADSAAAAIAAGIGADQAALPHRRRRPDPRRRRRRRDRPRLGRGADGERHPRGRDHPEARRRDRLAARRPRLHRPHEVPRSSAMSGRT